ncbi:hypothetical protein [Sinorhizobium meliloti]|uniref:hypothetical protein n=1 Tax=Rhizobium meliloti TaxID=382 RepID=UPI000FE04821|nr:hypothetical protein [Sinorhizobium meliloti]RVL53952.1 hypothetical protein CN141_25545 [Sinorhizobium meliloti]
MATLTVEIRVRWWVKPYLALALAFAWCMAWRFGQEEIDAFADNIAGHVVRHGLICRVRP